jgi:hypothetical protein
MADRRPNDTPADEESMEKKLEKTMDQAEGELDTVEEDLRQKENQQPRRQRD